MINIINCPKAFTARKKQVFKIFKLNTQHTHYKIEMLQYCQKITCNTNFFELHLCGILIQRVLGQSLLFKKSLLPNQDICKSKNKLKRLLNSRAFQHCICILLCNLLFFKVGPLMLQKSFTILLSFPHTQIQYFYHLAISQLNQLFGIRSILQCLA